MKEGVPSTSPKGPFESYKKKERIQASGEVEEEKEKWSSFRLPGDKAILDDDDTGKWRNSKS